MSSEPAIEVRGLGKAYRIQSVFTEGTLMEAAVAHMRQMLRRDKLELVWALKDVSFEVQPGEVVGIVGHNGAGKSTLLKLLSRITPPTEGEAVIRGRAGSLLEVGTGFHRELTGRENIYLNGGILGMNRAEINRHFDEIVDFSGVEKFLDTPVKRYSSGMFVRLAFAVAAHLRTEVLIVDEVLAVGDAQFQKKCLGKMEDAARSGRTVLLVSHNMGTIQSLCPRAIVLHQGQVSFDGNAEEAVRRYLALLENQSSLKTDLSERAGTGDVEINDVSLVDAAGQPLTSVIGGQDVALHIEYVNHTGLRYPSVTANLYDDQGRPITSFSTPLTLPELDHLGRQGRLVCHLPRLPLPPGRYRIALALQVDGQVTDTLKSAACFEVDSTVFYPTGLTPRSKQAAFLIDHTWSHEPREVSGAAPVGAHAEEEWRDG